jgi:hypothetical protein
MNTSHRPNESGWILFDTLIGAVILTIGLLGASLVFNESNQSLEQVTARQSAVALATSLFSVATAYGCGAETGLSLPGRPTTTLGARGLGYPFTASIWTECSSLYTGRSGSVFAGALGDPLALRTLPGGSNYSWTTVRDGVTYYVSYQAVWSQGAGGGSGCPPALAGGAAIVEPIGQTRILTVQWLDQRQPQVLQASSFGGVPVEGLEYSSPVDGGLLVTGMAPGSIARLSVSVPSFAPGQMGSVLIDRAASPGNSTSDSGCAWFPFLPPQPPGAYSLAYYANGDTAGAPSATAPGTLSVAPGAITGWAV